jgi:hypothetical protein
LDPLAVIEQALEDGSLAAAVQARQFGSALGAALSEVSKCGAFDAAEEVVETLDLIGPDLTPGERRALEEALAPLRELASMLTSATDASTLGKIPATVRGADVAAGLIQRQLKDAWRRTLEAEFTATEKLGGVLERLPRLRAIGQRLVAAARNALALAAQLPSARARTVLDRCRADRDAARRELSADGAGDAPVAFLLSVADGKATLGHVTAEVLEWLGQEDALSLFSVRLS